MTTKTTMPSSGGGLSFISLLTVLFIGLKLTGVINWSWMWVLSPVWISLGLSLVVAAVVIGVIGWLDRNE